MSDYGTILATTDFSEQALAGVEEAVRLAKRLGSKLVLLYVVEDRMPPVLDSATWSSAMREHSEVAERNLAAYAERHLAGVDHDAVVVAGRSHEVIVEQAAERGADLIVMATHGYGLLGQAVLGSTTERVLRHAPCPVLVVRERA
jgi:nucleotide-binding universal stress UspA family protein